MGYFFESLASMWGLAGILFLILSVVSFIILNGHLRTFLTALLSSIALLLISIGIISSLPKDELGPEILVGLQTDIPRDEEELAERLTARAVNETIKDEFRNARDSYERARSIYRNLGNILGEAEVALGLAILESTNGQLDTARANFSEALGLFRQGGSSLGASRSFLGWGDLERSIPSIDKAKDLYRQAIDEWERTPYSKMSDERIKTRDNSDTIINLKLRLVEVQSFVKQEN